MTHPPLFDHIDRTNATPAQHTESSYAFLNRVAGAYWDQIRELVEAWLSQYPQDGREDVRGRLQSGDDRQFLSAFWELYLYATFSRLGFSLEVHPALPTTSARPDFSAKQGDQECYIEALVLTEDEAEQFAEKRLSIIYDAINRTVHHPQFRLSFDEVIEGASQPRTKALCEQLNRWLQSLNATALLDSGIRPERLPTMTWSEGDWQIRFRALPVRSDHEGSAADRIIGIYNGRARMVNDHVLLLDRLRKKIRKYGALDRPLIIALNYCRWTSDENEIKMTLFGYLNDGTPELASGTIPQDWPADLGGLWVSKHGPNHRGVSAILVSFNLRPATVAKQVPTVWVNPWTVQPLLTDLPLQQRTVNVESGSITKTGAEISACELIGKMEGWPEGEAFPTRRSSATN